MKHLIKTQNLAIGYKNKTIAYNLNLSVSQGQLVSLLGPNGSGKSTLLRTLIGIQKSLQGVILIDNKVVCNQSPRNLSKLISIVLTDRFSGNLKVKELVALGRIPYTGWLGHLSSNDIHTVYDAMERVGIVDYADRKIAELSDGERQRVMIAKALAQDTPVMLLDEPTAHLDLPNKIAILYLLRSLAKKTGKAIVISMHELDIALQISDIVWIMERGNKMHCGAPEDMVLNGTLKSTFISDKVDFDMLSGTFKMLYKQSKEVHFTGNCIASHWTRQALEKEGYRISSDPFTTPRVEVVSEAALKWNVSLKGSKYTVDSISELITTLKMNNTVNNS